MKKWITFNNFELCINQNLIYKSIENIKNHLIDKKHAFWIVKDKYTNSYNIYEFKFNFMNFKNFWNYEKYLKQNKNYKKDFDLFLRYKKQNLNWYYENINNNKRIYKEF